MPKSITQLRGSHYWKKKVARVRAQLEREPGLAECWLCGEQIDMALPVNHPRGFSLDHVVPLARGGRIDGEARPAHISCNANRGAFKHEAQRTQGRVAWR